MSSYVLLIDDTLQRHTMAMGTEFISGDHFLSISRQEGEAWLERNRSIVTALTIPYQIMTWNQWIEHPNFPQKKNELDILYDIDESFKAAIDNTINDFLVRYDRRFDDQCFLDSPVARQLCKTYLIEECAAMCLWPELNCQFEVYPGHRNAAMTETHNRFVLPKHIDLLHPVRVKFKNKGQLKAQVFSILKEAEIA